MPRARESEVLQRSLATSLGAMEVVLPAFTRPGFRNAWVVFAGWVLTTGVHAVTQALVVTVVARRVHRERVHPFLSRGAWRPDSVGRLIFEHVAARLCPRGRIVNALDDTLAPKKGPEVCGLGSHLDPVRSTKQFRVSLWAHMGRRRGVVRVPFSPEVGAPHAASTLPQQKASASATSSLRQEDRVGSTDGWT